MRTRRAPFGWFLAAALVCGPGGLRAAPGTGPAAAAPAAGEQPAAEQPVHVSADMAEYYNKEGIVVFSGKVVASQADATLTADRMEVVFSPQAGAEGRRPAGTGTTAGERRITTITATGNVTFRQLDPETKKERYATGDKGVYDTERRTVTMTGTPRLWEDKNAVNGEEMVFHLDERKVIVKGKVNLTVYPEEAKGAEKP